MTIAQLRGAMAVGRYITLVLRSSQVSVRSLRDRHFLQSCHSLGGWQATAAG